MPAAALVPDPLFPLLPLDGAHACVCFFGVPLPNPLLQTLAGRVLMCSRVPIPTVTAPANIAIKPQVCISHPHSDVAFSVLAYDREPLQIVSIGYSDQCLTHLRRRQPPVSSTRVGMIFVTRNLDARSRRFQ